MNFKRPIVVLLLLCMTFVVGIVVTHMLRPSLNQRIGGRLFSVDPEAVTSIQCDVKDESGAWCTVQLKRDGARWFFISPYRGMMCDPTTISNVLSLTQQMRVLSSLGSLQETQFNAQQYLTYTTIEKSYTCGFNLEAEMQLDRVAVAVGEHVVTVDASVLKALPKTASELRSRALLPFTPMDYILNLTWRGEEGASFINASRLPNADWEVRVKNAPFVKSSEAIKPVLEALVKTDLIAMYVLVSKGSELDTEGHIPMDVLMKYGLDMESARLEVDVRGMDEKMVFSFGRPSKQYPDFIYCLLHASQSIVLVPAYVRDFFQPSGPFEVNVKQLPVVERGDEPTMVDLRCFSNGTHATYVRTGEHWENKALGIAVDRVAMQGLLKSLSDLRGDMIAVEQPEPTDVRVQVILQRENTSQTLLFSRDEGGDVHIYDKNAKCVYAITEDAFPEALLSETLVYDVLEKTALRLDPKKIQKITIERPGQGTLSIARDETVSGGWRTLQPVGGYVDVAQVERWLQHFAWMPARRLTVLDGRESVVAPWGLHEDGTPRYQMRILLDFDGTAEELRCAFFFAQTAQPGVDVPMVIQGRSVEYMIEASIVDELKRSPFVYEGR